MDRRYNPESDALSKADLDIIIATNKKSIELQLANDEQFGELVGRTEELKGGQERNLTGQRDIREDLKDIKSMLRDELKEIKSTLKELERNHFKLMLVLGTGIVGLIVQVITLVVKK